MARAVTASSPSLGAARGVTAAERAPRNGGRVPLKEQRQKRPADPTAAPNHGQNPNDFPLHSAYLSELFGQVLTAGTVGLLLGLAAATIFIHNTFPALTAYPAQVGLFIAFIALAWTLLRRAQGKTLLLWRKTWQTFEQRLAEASDLASRDDLTQLQNRRSFYQQLQQALEETKARKRPLAILTLDMDDLKAVNDEYGHQVGDTVLVHLARLLNKVARPTDITARLGGDEFAIIMPNTDRRGAEAMADHLWRDLETNPLHLNHNARIHIGVSIGISGFPWSGDTMDAIIHGADAGLYANKLTRKGVGEDGAQERRRLAAAVVDVLSSALDIRDKLTHRHSHRVAQLAAAVARQLQLGEDEVQIIQQAAALHDIGKIGVPDSVLWKASRLSPKEWSEMRRHCELGYHILSSIDLLQDAADIVHAHHERWDGQGYPRRLAGEEIPLGARIFAVVDAYDAMTSKRPYRDATTHEGALAEIARHAGSQFDPRVVAAFLEAMSQAEAPIEAGYEDPSLIVA